LGENASAKILLGGNEDLRRDCSGMGMVSEINCAATLLVYRDIPELLQVFLGRATSHSALIVVAGIRGTFHLLLTILTPLVLIGEWLVRNALGGVLFRDRRWRWLR